MYGQAVHNGQTVFVDALAAFAQHHEQDGRTEEWQVRQAVRSVELFQKHCLRVAECTRMRVKDLAEA